MHMNIASNIASDTNDLSNLAPPPSNNIFDSRSNVTRNNLRSSFSKINPIDSDTRRSFQRFTRRIVYTLLPSSTKKFPPLKRSISRFESKGNFLVNSHDNGRTVVMRSKTHRRDSPPNSATHAQPRSIVLLQKFLYLSVTGKRVFRTRVHIYNGKCRSSFDGKSGDKIFILVALLASRKQR